MGLPFLAIVSAAESLLTSWWQVIVVIVISFAVITVSWSAYRFRLMLENLKIPDQIDPEESLDFFQALIAQNISSIRSHAEFGVGIIRSPEISPDELHDFIQSHMRNSTDALIRVKDWVGVIIFGEAQGLDCAFARWQDELNVTLHGGATFFPNFARTSIELISAAEEAINQVPADESGLIWAEPEEDEGAPQEEQTTADEEEYDEEAEIAADSSLDPLTGVLAAHKAPSYMRKYIGEYRRRHSMALFLIGLNNMDDVEELHGEEVADAVRKALGDLIQNSLREDDIIGRFDQDEFLALIICEPQYVAGVAKRLRDSSQQLVVNHNNRRIRMTVNIGVSMCPQHGRSLPAMFNAAQTAYDVACRRQGSMYLIAGEE